MHFKPLSLMIIYPLMVILCTSCRPESKSSSEKVDKVFDTLAPSIDHKVFIGKDYLIDDQHSYVGFKIKYFGFSPVRGRFDSFDGTIFYEAGLPSSLSLSVVVDVTSINTGNNDRDQDLLEGNGWFGAGKYPYLWFISKKVVRRPDEGFDLIGDFTMKGVTKEITIHFKKPTDISRDFAGNEQIDYSGNLILNRTDFGIEGDDFWSTVMENGLTQLSDEVEIELDIHSRRADYQIRFDDYEATNIRRGMLKTIQDKGLGAGLDSIDVLHRRDQISRGAISSIGYTLNTWEMHEEAKAVFEKRRAFYPENKASYNQLGITDLFLMNYEAAERNFKAALRIDSNDTRAKEYLRLMARME